MDYSLQHNSLVNDYPVEPDAAQRQDGVAGKQQREPPRQGSFLDLDNDRSNPEALQAGRQREPGNPSSDSTAVIAA